MKQPSLHRREFLALLGAGFWAACSPSDGSQRPSKGEEWRQNRRQASTDLAAYRLSEAQWAEAQARIEKHRQGDFLLRLVDAQGEPLPGVKVHCRQLNHAFDWGLSSAGTWPETDPVDQRSSRHIAALFNCTTAKCYWDERWHQPIEHEEGQRITARFEAEVAWGQRHGLRVKGHPLVWTVRKAIPRWMDRYPYAQQLQRLEAHVRDLIRVGGREVSRWDLCNEMLWEPSLRHLPQRNWPHLEPIDEILSYLEPAVHWAREENPAAIYSLNDYGLVVSGIPDQVTAEQQRSRYLQLIEEMDRRGCLPDAIGSQGHVASWYTAEEFQRMLDHLGQAGLPLQITEFWAQEKGFPGSAGDAGALDAARQDYLRMAYTLAFAHPQVSHLTYWGGRRVFFDEKGEPSGAYQALKALIRGQWWTETDLHSNAEGELRLHAYFGQYELQAGQRRQRLDLSQPQNGSIRTVVLS